MNICGFGLGLDATSGKTNMIKTYFSLTKPGIIMGNAITAAGGFALASQGPFDYRLFLATLIGLSFIIASACVLNNYIDSTIDKKMERTKNRALAKGLISAKKALIFAVFLGLFGILVLSAYDNLLAVLVAASGFSVYVLWYSFWKYRSSYATMIGSIAGAVPPVVGYCAVSSRFDGGALILFMIVALWQMPHFFAIAMYRLDDYINASIPVFPATNGMHATKIHMLIYIIAFIIATCMLTLFGFMGYVYLAIACVLGLSWLWLCIRGFTSCDDKLWARKMFILSLVVITVFCLTVIVGRASLAG